MDALSPDFHLRQFPWVALVAAAAIAVSACGTNPIGPDVALSCPADIRVDSPDGGPVPITFATPEAAAGTPPYSVSCIPQSGSSLPVGSTLITCTVADSRNRSASCSFNVTVVRPPRLTRTRFLAFGDSLTEGHWNETNLPTLVEEPDSYPTKLQTALRAYYRGQSIVVLNDGVGGELVSGPSAHSAGGTIRLPLELDANRPDVLLLMEGSNDLVLDSISADDVQSAAIEGLGRMIDTAQGRGVSVFLATIPPMSSSGTKRLAPDVVASVPVYNNRVRALAASRGLPLVDVYAALEGRPELLSPDGLHLAIAGYERIAQLFFDAIKARLGE